MYRSVNDPKRQSPYDLQNNSSASMCRCSNNLCISTIPALKRGTKSKTKALPLFTGSGKRQDAMPENTGYGQPVQNVYKFAA